MSHVGDRAVGATVYFSETTAVNGLPTTLSGTPSVACYLDSTTEITTGITLTVDYDGRTGLNRISIDTSSGYTAGKHYDVVITAGTVGGVSVVGHVVGSFSLALPATANVTQFGSSNGTFSGGRPEVNTSHAAGTAWNSGAIGASTLASDTIAAAKIATGAITSAKFAAGAIDAAAIADNAIDAGAIAADAITAAKIADGAIDAATFAAGAITASAIAADAIGASELAADAVSEIAAAISIPSAATVAAAVWDLDATGHQTQGTFGQAIGDPGADADTLWGLANTNLDAAVSSRSSHSAADVWAVATRVLTAGTNIGFPTAATIATAVWDALTSALTTVGSIGKLVVDNVNASLSAIKAKTDNLPADPADASDVAAAFSSLQSHGDGAWATATGFSTLDAAGVRTAVGLASANLDTQIGDLPTNAELATALGTADDAVLAAIAALNDPTAAAIADAVWEEAIADHSGTAGSVAEQLAAAGAAGDPWATALPGSYTAGQAGKILGDNLNATVSSRMPTTHIAATAGKVDGVALVDVTTTNTDMRGTDNAATAASLATTDGKADAIKAKTDSLTFTIAGVLDGNVKYVNDVAVTGTGTEANPWGP